MIRLAVRVAAADAEIVLAELLELVAGGVEEVELDGGARIEYAVYGAPGELPDLPQLRAAARRAQVEVSSSAIADDWDERWKQFHRPVLIESPAPALVPALRVRPPWEVRSEDETPQTRGVERREGIERVERGECGERGERGERGDGEETIEIVIDPGQAFGTGGHASTRLCLQLLLALAATERSRGPLLDVGTGSGVLAIAAAKLGYRPVTGLDYDRASVLAAVQNANANGVRMEVERLDLRTEPIPWLDSSSRAGEDRPRMAIVANLLRPLLLDLANALPAAPSDLLAGGLLAGEVDEIAEAYADRMGMVERERRRSGDWAAVWLQSG